MHSFAETAYADNQHAQMPGTSYGSVSASSTLTSYSYYASSLPSADTVRYAERSYARTARTAHRTHPYASRQDAERQPAGAPPAVPPGPYASGYEATLVTSRYQFASTSDPAPSDCRVPYAETTGNHQHYASATVTSEVVRTSARNIPLCGISSCRGCLICLPGAFASTSQAAPHQPAQERPRRANEDDLIDWSNTTAGQRDTAPYQQVLNPQGGQTSTSYLPYSAYGYDPRFLNMLGIADQNIPQQGAAAANVQPRVAEQVCESEGLRRIRNARSSN